MKGKSIRDEYPRFIAIDYGTKRIGIAVSDPTGTIASPLATVNNDEKFWKLFKEAISQFTVTAFVLGYPLKENGGKTSLTDEVEKFAEKLRKKFGKEVIFADERYSSSIAESQIIESVKSKKKRRNKALIDKTAAAVILQSFLDSKN